MDCVFEVCVLLVVCVAYEVTPDDDATEDDAETEGDDDAEDAAMELSWARRRRYMHRMCSLVPRC